MTAEVSAREIRAAGPRPEAGEIRRAYLELLKLCLCDLTGSSTTSVEGLPHGHVVSRELTGDDLRLRAEGRDWPLHGLTMSGLRRLDDLQACVEAIVRDGVDGDLIEAGCWRGGSSILMRATLDSLGVDERTVWAADSFQGFPAADADADGDRSAAYPTTLEPYLAVFDFLSAPLDEVRTSFTRFGFEQGVRFVPGFFEETLPGLADRRWSVVRLDGDTYEATLLGLRCLYPGLSVGGYLIVDDYGALEECRAAVERFRDEHAIAEPVEQVDWTCVRWRRESDDAIEPVEPASAPMTSARAPARPRERPEVPTRRELELAAELADLRERATDLESELARLERLEDELRAMTGSRSWRLTRPVRELGRYIRERQR